MRLIPTLTFFLFVSFCGNAQPLSGFSSQSSEDQRQAEEKFDGYLRAENLDTWMKKLSARPHHLGSPFGRESAEFIRDQFRSWGYDAEIETFQVLFPTPRIRLLELTGPGRYKAKLSERILREDANSGFAKEQLPPYNCWCSLLAAPCCSTNLVTSYRT